MKSLFNLLVAGFLCIPSLTNATSIYGITASSELVEIDAASGQIQQYIAITDPFNRPANLALSAITIGPLGYLWGVVSSQPNLLVGINVGSNSFLNVGEIGTGAQTLAPGGAPFNSSFGSIAYSASNGNGYLWGTIATQPDTLVGVNLNPNSGIPFGEIGSGAHILDPGGNIYNYSLGTIAYGPLGFLWGTVPSQAGLILGVNTSSNGVGQIGQIGTGLIIHDFNGMPVSLGAITYGDGFLWGTLLSDPSSIDRVDPSTGLVLGNAVVRDGVGNSVALLGIAAVPEPEGVAMLIAGLVLIRIIAVRRSSNAVHNLDLVGRG